MTDVMKWPEGVGQPGTLQIGVFSGIDLARVEFFSKTTPYVIISVNGEEIGQTKIAPKTTRPKWNEVFTVHIPVGSDITDCKVEFAVYHNTGTVTPKFLGCCCVEGQQMIWFSKLGFSESDASVTDHDDLFTLTNSPTLPTTQQKYVQGKLDLRGRYFPHKTPTGPPLGSKSSSKMPMHMITEDDEELEDNKNDQSEEAKEMNDSSIDSQSLQANSNLAPIQEHFHKIQVDTITITVHELKIYCTKEQISDIHNPAVQVTFNGIDCGYHLVEKTTSDSMEPPYWIIPPGMHISCPVYRGIDLRNSKLIMQLVEDRPSNGSDKIPNPGTTTRKSYGMMTTRNLNLFELLQPHRPKSSRDHMGSSSVDAHGARGSSRGFISSRPLSSRSIGSARDDFSFHTDSSLLSPIPNLNGDSNSILELKPRLPSRQRSRHVDRDGGKDSKVHESALDPFTHRPVIPSENYNASRHWYNFYQYVIDENGNRVRDARPSAAGKFTLSLLSNVGLKIDASETPSASLGSMSSSASPFHQGSVASQGQLSLMTGDSFESAPSLTSHRDQFQQRIHSIGLITEDPPRPPTASTELLMTARSQMRSRGYTRTSSRGALSIHTDSNPALDSPNLDVNNSLEFMDERHNWEIEFDALERQEEQNLVDRLEGEGYHFTKHLDEASGRFFYFNHLNQTSTWDKPHADIALHHSDAHKEINETIRWNRFVEKKIASHHREETLDAIRQHEALDTKITDIFENKVSERELRTAWHDALETAAKNRDPRGCEVTLSWKPFKVHPMLFTFEKDYYTRLVTLRLEGMSLEALPSEVGVSLINLEVLSLSTNRISVLPDTLVKLTNLRELILINNTLSELPKKIGLLSSLQKLELSNNRLATIPDTFAALTRLHRLNLEHNHLVVLPENLDFMVSCKAINVNWNRLVRLPKCLSRMPKLLFISACGNLLTYIPRELCFCRYLRALRLSRNMITSLPDVFGDLRTLRDLGLDYNDMRSIPASFYMLTRLTVLRLELNQALAVPAADIIAGGAKAVVGWAYARWVEDEQWRMKFIINSVQKYLAQLVDVMDLLDLSRFEPKVEMFDDIWYALQLDYLWTDLMPALKQLDREKYRFPFSPSEVMWAFKNFDDANGPLLRYEIAEFRRCSCVDNEGRRVPCIPPRRGYMCTRLCALVKDRIVLQADREHRLWLAQKKNGIEEAVNLAEREAVKYLESQEGKNWAQELSFQQAEDEMTDRGVDRVIKKRKRRAENRKQAVITRYNRTKKKITKARDVRAQSIRKQISALTARAKKSTGGFVKETLDKEIDDLTQELANMVENEQLLSLTNECEAKCKAIDDELLEAASDESDEDEEENESSDEDEDADILAEANEERRIREMELKLRKQEGKARARFGGKGDESVSDSRKKEIEEEEERRHARNVRRIRKEREAAKKRAKFQKRLRYAADVVDVRMNRILLNVNGTFNEVQQQLEHEIRRQYIANSMASARREAERHYAVLGRIRQNWEGLGLEYCFTTWVKWVGDKTRRLRRDKRMKYRNALREFEAGLSCVRIAKLNVDFWQIQTDIYSDKPFWVHRRSKEITWVKPRLEHYVHPQFTIPEPPEPLPEGMSLDTSESEPESDHEVMGNDEVSAVTEAEGVDGNGSEDVGSQRGENHKGNKGSKDSEGDEENQGDVDEDDEEGSRPKIRKRRLKKKVPSGESSAIDKVQKNSMKKRLKALRNGNRTGTEAALQEFLKQRPGSSETSAVISADMLGDLTLIRGMTGTQEVIEEDIAKDEEKPGYMPERKWKPRWLNDATNATTKGRTKGDDDDHGFVYGPDSIRLGRQRAGGLVLRTEVPLFSYETWDRPSTRERRLLALTRDYVMPTLEAIEQQLKDAPAVSSALTELFDTPAASTKEDTKAVVAISSLKEQDEALVRVQERRKQARAVRHDTMLRQLNRRPTALADREVEAELKAKEEEERIALENKKTDEFEVLKADQLLELAGGELTDDRLVVGEKALQQRTVLAKKAVDIKYKYESDAHEKGVLRAPKPKTFYERQIGFMFKPDHYSSSDDDDDDKKAADEEKNDVVGELKPMGDHKEAKPGKRRASNASTVSKASVASHANKAAKQVPIQNSASPSVSSKAVPPSPMKKEPSQMGMLVRAPSKLSEQSGPQTPVKVTRQVKIETVGSVRIKRPHK